MVLDTQDGKKFPSPEGNNPLDTIPIGFAQINRDGIIVGWNSMLTDLTGLVAEEVIGKNILAVHHIFSPHPQEDAQGNIATMMHTMFDQGTATRQLTEIVTLHNDDGSGRELKLEFKRSEHTDGTPILNIVATDITIERRMQNVLNFLAQVNIADDKEGFFNQLAGILHYATGMEYVLVGEIDRDQPDVVNTVVFSGPQGLERNFHYPILGTPCETVIGRQACVYPEGVAEQFPEDTGLSERGITSYAGVPLMDNSNNPLGILAVMDSRPIQRQDLASMMLQAVADKTTGAIFYWQNEDLKARFQRKLEEEVEQRTSELNDALQELRVLGRMRDEFFGDVAHELRKPLTVIALYTHIWERKPERAGEALTMIKKAIKDHEEMIEQLLTLSRIDQKKLEVAIEPVFLGGFLNSVIESHRLAAAEKGIDLEISLPEEDSLVNTDAHLLEVAVCELITNGTKYTPEGGSVLVEFEETVEGKKLIHISDSGAGISLDDMEHIFERFYRSNQVKAAHIPGTGLGLAIVQDIVRLLGGEVICTSPGKLSGATFTICLP